MHQCERKNVKIKCDGGMESRNLPREYGLYACHNIDYYMSNIMHTSLTWGLVQQTIEKSAIL